MVYIIFFFGLLSLSLCACIRLNWSFPMREESHAPRAYEGTAARSSQKPARLPVVTCFKWFSSLSFQVFQPWFDGSMFAFRPAALIGPTAAESRSPRGLCVGRFLVTFCHSESETLRQNSFFIGTIRKYVQYFSRGGRQHLLVVLPIFLGFCHKYHVWNHVVRPSQLTQCAERPFGQDYGQQELQKWKARKEELGTTTITRQKKLTNEKHSFQR
jgi:hypothetical protein